MTPEITPRPLRLSKQALILPALSLTGQNSLHVFVNTDLRRSGSRNVVARRRKSHECRSGVFYAGRRNRVSSEALEFRSMKNDDDPQDDMYGDAKWAHCADHSDDGYSYPSEPEDSSSDDSNNAPSQQSPAASPPPKSQHSTEQLRRHASLWCQKQRLDQSSESSAGKIKVDTEWGDDDALRFCADFGFGELPMVLKLHNRVPLSMSAAEPVKSSARMLSFVDDFNLEAPAFSFSGEPKSLCEQLDFCLGFVQSRAPMLAFRAHRQRQQAGGCLAPLRLAERLFGHDDSGWVSTIFHSQEIGDVGSSFLTHRDTLRYIWCVTVLRRQLGDSNVGVATGAKRRGLPSTYDPVVCRARDLVSSLRLPIGTGALALQSLSTLPNLVSLQVDGFNLSEPVKGQCITHPGCARDRECELGVVRQGPLVQGTIAALGALSQLTSLHIGKHKVRALQWCMLARQLTQLCSLTLSLDGPEHRCGAEARLPITTVLASVRSLPPHAHNMQARVWLAHSTAKQCDPLSHFPSLVMVPADLP